MRWAGIILVFFHLSLLCQIKEPEYIVSSPTPLNDSLVTIGSISLSGNKITHNKIIYRELEFTSGEQLSVSFLDSLIIKSTQNLMNRSIFNFVTISKNSQEQLVNVEVAVVERWYIWPIPIINTAGRNINAWWETKDFERLNYGIDLRVENFRGRLEKLNILVQGGFDQTLAVTWTIPYLTKKQFMGIGIGGGYQRNREIIAATEGNKPVFYEPEDGYAQKRGFAGFDVTFRPKFNFLHTLSLGFDHYTFNDSLMETYPDFAFDNTKYNFITLGYEYKHDFRDYKPYPLDGYYFGFAVVKQGFGITGNDIDTWSVSAVVDQYVPIYKRWYFAYSFTALITSEKEKPYFLTPGFGYLGMEIRGYELYIINGQEFGLFKSNFKFEIIPRTVKRIKGIKTEKFGKIFYALYANLFFDFGYANDIYEDGLNPLANQLLWGTGIGIDFVTYYDLVIRFEYTLNKQGDHGFFINLVAPI